MDLLIPPGIKDLGIGGLVLLGLLSLLRGWLIPRSLHEDRIRDLKEQLAEKDKRAAVLEAALSKRDEQLAKSLDNNQIAANALEAIRREAAKTT